MKKFLAAAFEVVLWLATLGTLLFLAFPALTGRDPFVAAECGCGERSCTMPCSTCCPGAGPQGCPPPPTRAGLRPDPAPEEVRRAR